MNVRYYKSFVPAALLYLHLRTRAREKRSREQNRLDVNGNYFNVAMRSIKERFAKRSPCDGETYCRLNISNKAHAN